MLADDDWRMRVEQRFWPKVARLLDWSACWEWRAGRKASGQGYGTFKLRSHLDARAHRVAYALFYGQSPGGLFVCHRCDNPSCVNPRHLFLGTCADNAADMVSKGRWRSVEQAGESNGAAKLTAAQVDEVRGLILSGLTNKAIAARYDVSHSLISRIRRGRSWGSEPMQPRYASLKTPLSLRGGA